MRTSAQAFDTEQLLSVSQAASLLGVHHSTIRRWINSGRLRAFRVGGKAVRVSRGDVLRLAVPLEQQTSLGEGKLDTERLTVRPLTEQEIQQGLVAIEQLKRLQAEMLEANGGKPFSDSVEILHETREERTRELMRSHDP